MKKTERFFEEKNNGKSVDKMHMDGDFISPSFAVELMQEYAVHYHQQKLEEDKAMILAVIDMIEELRTEKYQQERNGIARALTEQVKSLLTQEDK